MAMLTLIAVSLFRTEDRIATPCSLKAKERYFVCFPFKFCPFFSKVAFETLEVAIPLKRVVCKNLRENAQYCALPAHLYASFQLRKAPPDRGPAALACLEFESLGLDVTTAIRLFLKQAINPRCIPFDIVPPQREFTDSTLAAIEEAKKTC